MGWKLHWNNFRLYLNTLCAYLNILQVLKSTSLMLGLDVRIQHSIFFKKQKKQMHCVIQQYCSYDYGCFQKNLKQLHYWSAEFELRSSFWVIPIFRCATQLPKSRARAYVSARQSITGLLWKTFYCCYCRQLVLSVTFHISTITTRILTA